MQYVDVFAYKEGTVFLAGEQLNLAKTRRGAEPHA